MIYTESSSERRTNERMKKKYEPIKNTSGKFGGACDRQNGLVKRSLQSARIEIECEKNERYILHTRRGREKEKPPTTTVVPHKYS